MQDPSTCKEKVASIIEAQRQRLNAEARHLAVKLQFYEGKKAFLKDDYALAKIWLDAALEQPNLLEHLVTDALFMRGVSKIQEGDVDSGEADLQRVIKRDREKGALAQQYLNEFYHPPYLSSQTWNPINTDKNRLTR